MLKDLLAAVVGMSVVLLSAWGISLLALRLRCLLSRVPIWRMPRATLAVLLVMAMVATIEAQKRGADRGNSSSSINVDLTGGTTTPREHAPSCTGGATNETLRFTSINVNSNIVVLSASWPANLLPGGSVLDLFSAWPTPTNHLVWVAGTPVSGTETNKLFVVEMGGLVSGTSHVASAFFRLSERTSSANTMADTDGDGLPDIYEVRNGTNPYVQDYVLAPRIVAGGVGANSAASLKSALAISGEYSIIEISPGIHSGDDWTGLHLPSYPVLITSPDGGRNRTVTLRHSDQMAAFYLDATQRTETVIQGLCIDLVADSGHQMGFWCGGNMIWSGLPAAGTFKNISLRMPNPNVQYFGWFFRHWESNDVVIAASVLNAAGATNVRGIYAIDSPPMSVENCTFANFPPCGGGTTGYGIQYETTAANWGHAPAVIPLEIVNCLFDDSFSNAYALAPLEQGVAYDVTMWNCLVPSPLTYLPDHEYGTVVTNAMTSWSGHLLDGSPAIGAGTEAFYSSFDIDGQLRDTRPDIGADEHIPDTTCDTDNDGLSDYDEIAQYGTDPYRSDSDFDGVTDADEIEQETDPTDPQSFLQTLTVIVTNTAAPASPVSIAWGSSESGWDTNGLVRLPSGIGTTIFNNLTMQGATHIKAYCDLNGNGEYDEGTDVMLSSTIPNGGTAQVSFHFGDLDHDGVSDMQEREDGTNPYDNKNFRLDVSVRFESSDAVEWLTNHVAWGYAGLGWSTNGLASFADEGITLQIDAIVTNGEVYAKMFRDFNGNGVYDAGIDALGAKRLDWNDNGKTVTFAIGDSDGDGIHDSVEIAEGTDQLDILSFRMAATVRFESSDAVEWLTNHVAWGYAGLGWSTNGLACFADEDMTLQIDAIVTNGEVYAKMFRDFNGNGVYDAGIDALGAKRLDWNDNGKTVTFAIGDSDGDGIHDGVEIAEGTNPLDNRNYCFSISAKVTGIFSTTNNLTLLAKIGEDVLCEPLVMASNIWTADFGHVTATNGERVMLTFWDDINSNNFLDADEVSVNLTLPVTNHANSACVELPYGAFDADNNDMPDWWEATTGLISLYNMRGKMDDPDGDGLINLHEYWNSSDPLTPDGSNTLLSVMARSIDEKIFGKNPTNSILLFLNYAQNGTNFIRNIDCWAASIDLTCASPWNSYGNHRQHAGTAISPRHIILATHYETPINTVYFFVATNGNVYSRTMISKLSVGYDISVGLLDSDLPDDIHPANFLSLNYSKWLNTGYGLPVLTLDQEEKPLVMELNALPTIHNTAVTCHESSIPDRVRFYEPLIVGDSSNPRFLIIEDQPILLHTMWNGGQGSGTFVTLFLNEIQEKMDVLLPGYNLQIIDLTQFPVIPQSRRRGYE